MEQPYSQKYTVRLHDVDAWGRIRTNIILQYLEQTATEVTAVLGFPAEWYEAAGTAWVMRSIILQRLNDATYGDELVATTWVSDQQRVRMYTEYEVNRADGEPVAVGRAEWVYVDRKRQMPKALDPELMKGWPTGAASSLWRQTPADAKPDPDPTPEKLTFRAAFHEATAIRHTNNTIYAIWFEEAARLALRSWGYPLKISLDAILDPPLYLQFLSIRFYRSTYPDDIVTITTANTGTAPEEHRLALRQEIHGATSDLLVQADSVYILPATVQ